MEKDHFREREVAAKAWMKAKPERKHSFKKRGEGEKRQDEKV